MNTVFEHVVPEHHLKAFPKLYEIASALGVVKEWTDYLDQGVLRENHLDHAQTSLEGAERLAAEVAVDARSTVLNDFTTWMLNEMRAAQTTICNAAPADEHS